MSINSDYTNHTIAVYAGHDQAEAAVRLLGKDGFDLKKLSIIGQDYHSEERPMGFVNTGDRMISWGKYGAFWGSIWGLLFGSAFMFVPGVGYMVFAGYIISMLEGAFIGGSFGVVGGALVSLGVPEQTVLKYETHLNAGSFLLIAHGNELETTHAKEILATTTTVQLDSYRTNAVLSARH